MRLYLVLFITFLLSFFTCLPVQAQEHIQYGDYMKSGEDVFVNDPVEGDVFIAGESVKLRSTIGGNAFIVGQRVEIEGTVQGSAYIIAEEVVIDGTVSHNLMMATSSGQVRKSARIGRNLYATGEAVSIDGTIGGAVFMQGREFKVRGTIENDVNAMAQVIDLDNMGGIMGVLNYYSYKKYDLSEDAVAGGVVHHEFDNKEKFGTFAQGLGLYGFVVMLFGHLVLGMVLIKVWSRNSLEMLFVMHRAPLKNGLIGLLALFLMPFILFLLIITMIGIPLAFVILCLMSMIIVFSFIISSLYIGYRIIEYWYVKKAMKPVGADELMKALLVGTGLYALLMLIPFVSALVFVLSLTIGTGTILVWFKRHMEA